MRNASFRLAKDSFRFRCFWGLLAPEAKRRESFILRSGAERRVSKDEVFEKETEGAKKLRKSAANPAKIIGARKLVRRRGFGAVAGRKSPIGQLR
jgi:hypothetical protein